MHRVKVFDFDGTIYGGDSSIDFFLFALKKHKKLIWKIPLILWYGFLYSLRIIKIEKWKEYFFSFLAEIHDNKKLVEEFWRMNARKLNDELMRKLADDTSCVISASPEFLVKPCFSKLKNVTVIATRVDTKTGKIKGKNCRGIEKINRFNKVFRDAKIAELYSDSEKDRPLARIAEKAYIVDKGKVLPWDEVYLRRKKVRKISWGLFILFFIVYLIGGILLSYNYNFKENLDLLFSSDSARVIDDYSQIVAAHYRLTVHPLFTLLFQPIILVLKGITMNEILAIVLFSAVVGALAVVLMFKFIALFQKSLRTCIILSLIYGFSFAALVFNCSIEVYGVAALSLLFLWYQIAKVLKGKWEKNTTIWLYIAAILTISITITNYAVFLIGCLVLLLSRKASFRKLLLINLAAILTVVVLSFYQQAVWHSPAPITDILTHTTDKEVDFLDTRTQPLVMIKNVIKNDYYNLFMTSPPIIILNKGSDMMEFNDVSIAGKILTSVMFLILLLFIFWHRKKDRLINCGLILTLACFSFLHLIYGNDSTFLYALHFLYLIMGLIGINFVDEEKKSYVWFLGFFVLYFVVMLFKNLPAFNILIVEVAENINPTFFGENFSIVRQLAIIVGIIILMSICVVILLRNLRGIIRIKVLQPVSAKKILVIVAAVYAILTVFIAVEATSHYQRLFWWDLHPVEVKDSEIAKSVATEKNYLTHKEKALEYQEEYQKYRKACQEETGEELPNATIYRFSNDGREVKYENGVLKYVDNDEIIARLDAIEQIIVPSQNLVLVSTWNEKYIAVQGDENGVHIYGDGKDGVIKDTVIDKSS